QIEFKIGRGVTCLINWRQVLILDRVGRAATNNGGDRSVMRPGELILDFVRRAAGQLERVVAAGGSPAIKHDRMAEISAGKIDSELVVEVARVDLDLRAADRSDGNGDRAGVVSRDGLTDTGSAKNGRVGRVADLVIQPGDLDRPVIGG